MLTFMSRFVATQPHDIHELCQTHYDEVWRFCARRLGSQNAADAAQDAFLIALEKRSFIKPGVDPKAWLFTIALNVCRNHARRRGREPFSVETLHEAAPNVWSHVVDRQVLIGALAKLSESHREIIVLNFIDGFQYEEIAQLLAIPVGTVKSRIHHALLNLRNTLEEKGAQS